jgi:hypothetical protein
MINSVTARPRGKAVAVKKMWASNEYLRSNPMVGKLFFHAASVAAALVASAFIVDYDPSATAQGTAAQGTAAAPFSVNRTLKGDLLPLDVASRYNPGTADSERREAPARKKAPDGCDPSFSPIAAPRLADVFGRCAT